MKVWMVFVCCDRNSNRFLDSQWATKERAEDRIAELKESFRCFGCEVSTARMGMYAYLGEGTVTDIAITETAAKEGQDEEAA